MPKGPQGQKRPAGVVGNAFRVAGGEETDEVDPENTAVQRVGELLDCGDRDGELVWLRISRAVAGLRAAPTGPPN